MRTLLVVNPASGQGKAAQEKRKLLDLAAMMPQVRTETTSDPEAISLLAAQAAAEHYDLIVAAGGDGTINAVVNGVGDSRIPLGIIPLGTGNVLAHHLGIPGLCARGSRATPQVCPHKLSTDPGRRVNPSGQGVRRNSGKLRHLRLQLQDSPGCKNRRRAPRRACVRSGEGLDTAPYRTGAGHTLPAALAWDGADLSEGRETHGGV